MSDILSELGTEHFDILRELGNIGAGNAITSLSKILNEKIKMQVPTVNLVDFNDIAGVIGGPENIIFGIMVSLSGDINGMMMFLIEKKSAQTLINMLMDKEINDESEFSEMEMSALQEIGNILTSSYMSSLATIINKKIVPSVPFLAMDMAGAILSVPAIEFGKVADKVLFIESLFSAQDQNVSGFFLLVPDPPSFKLLLSILGVV